MNFAKQVRNILEGSDPEYSTCVLDHQFSEPTMWRLDVGRGKWLFLRWDKDHMNAAESVALGDEEVLGFLKARFPEANIRRELLEAVKVKLMRDLAALEKEAAPS